MDIKFNLFPQGRSMALTMSYDDGRIYDRQLVEIFNRYKIRGTFHLVSNLLDTPGYISSSEIKTLYKGHEVACHSNTHPFLNQLPLQMLLKEFETNRAGLELLCGYPVRGMSWPFGLFNEPAVQAAQICGMEYSRTTHSTGKLSIPNDFMQWNPTAHHSENPERYWKMLLDNHRHDMRLLYLWGHSYEFEEQANWKQIEEFCAMAAGRDDVWYATNIEIKSYIDALHRLIFDSRLEMAYNPSALDVWFSSDGIPVHLPAGAVCKGN